MILALFLTFLTVQPNPSVSDATAQAQGDALIVVATISNPSMYDVYVTSATSDAAGKIELIQGDKPVTSLTVPAYGSLELKAGGPHVKLSSLKMKPKAGGEVTLTLQTDGGVAIAIAAVVK